MVSATGVILVTMLVLADIWTVKANNSSSYYCCDITKSLSSCISNLFYNAKSDQVEKFIDNVQNYDGKTFEYEVDHDEEPFHNKFFFGAINITAGRSVIGEKKPYVHCQFRDNKLAVFMPKTLFQIFTDLGAAKDTVFVHYTPVLYFLNMSIFVTKLPKNNDEVDKFSVNYTYDRLGISHAHKERYTMNLTTDRKFELEVLIRKALPSLLYENIETNTKFLHALDENFFSQPGKDLNSTHSQFLTFQQQHYYFIPNIPFYWFNLCNVTIGRLWNFESLDINETSSKDINTLVVKNVIGTFTFDYGCEIEKRLEFHFMADYFLISVRYGYDVDKSIVINETNVEARDYRVIRTVLDTPITNLQAALIMQKVESAVALTIWPSIRTWKNRDQPSNMYESENVLEKVFAETTQKPDIKSIKQLLSKWIPFKEN